MFASSVLAPWAG